MRTPRETRGLSGDELGPGSSSVCRPWLTRRFFLWGLPSRAGALPLPGVSDSFGCKMVCVCGGGVRSKGLLKGEM